MDFWLARECTLTNGHADSRGQTGKRCDRPALLVGGQRVLCRREALNELDAEDAYAVRLRGR